MICAPLAPWVMAVYAREIDKGYRCAPWRPGRAHRRGGGSCCARRLCTSLSQGGRGRGAQSDGAGSDPAVRGPATGSGPGAFAHPRPRPLGSLPDQRSLLGKAARDPRMAAARMV